MKKSLISVSIIAASLTLAACGGSSSNSTPTPSFEFKVDVINLTNAQPLSPPAIVAHNSGYKMFDEATRASVALEHLAESGSNSQIIEEAESNTAAYDSEAATTPIGPGSSGSYTLVFKDSLDDAKISIATMLVNTNDAFTGEKNLDISTLEVNASFSINGPVWDAGTEGNSETAETIPGPAGSSVVDSNKLFDAERSSDLNYVVFHSGVVTADDGLTTSALNEGHRFDQPASRITITRIR
jgi:hypothetical protein